MHPYGPELPRLALAFCHWTSYILERFPRIVTGYSISWFSVMLGSANQSQALVAAVYLDEKQDRLVDLDIGLIPISKNSDWETHSFQTTNLL